LPAAAPTGSFDARGEFIRGLLEIDEAQAIVVERIVAEFAAGRSSIQIATCLIAEGIPGRVAASGMRRRSAGTRRRRRASSTIRSMSVD
jgi:hypothetical protein